MAEELEEPSHFRLLMSKHGDELGHFSVQERIQCLQDFHNTEAIPEGKSQELFDTCDKILSDRDTIKQLDIEINERQHKILEARKEAALQEENVTNLQQKIKDIKKEEGPKYQTLPILEKVIHKQKKTLTKIGRNKLLKRGIFDALVGSSAPERYRVPKEFNEKDFGTFADMSASDLLNTCNALRIFLAKDSGATDLMTSMKKTKQAEARLTQLQKENEDLRGRKALTDENRDLEEQIHNLEKKYARMKRNAAEEKERRIEHMAIKETEDEMDSGLSPFNPVSIINFFMGVGSQDEGSEVITKAERSKRKAIESHMINAAASNINDSKVMAKSKRKSRHHESLFVKE